MHRFVVVGKSPESRDKVRAELEAHGFVHDEKNPDVVLSYGGDGTFLQSERKYPSIPKVLIRDSKICKKCHNVPTEHVLKNLVAGKYVSRTYMKLTAEINGTRMEGVNEVTIRNTLPIHAIRFEVAIDGRRIDGELIGDGVTIATPFGSTGYYFSMTRHSFEKGLGIAFNNLVAHMEPHVVHEEAVITVRITRGEARVAVDHAMVDVRAGDNITVRKSDTVATILEVTGGLHSKFHS